MPQQHFSEFERLLLRSKNELGLSVLLILAWIAASDGVIDKEEEKKIAEIANASNHGHIYKRLIEIARFRDIDAFQLACEIIKNNFQNEKGKLFLEMSIGVAISDRFLRPTENHILRFLADLLGISRQEFDNLFLSITGQRIPDPSDPSTAEYWEQHAGSQRNQDEPDSDHHGDSRQSEGRNRSQPRNNRLLGAYDTLGLRYGASKNDIRRAYRKLAQVHHPDKFSSLGAEAVAAATTTFQQIKLAYDYLVNYA